MRGRGLFWVLSFPCFGRVGLASSGLIGIIRTAEAPSEQLAASLEATFLSNLGRASLIDLRLTSGTSYLIGYISPPGCMFVFFGGFFY